MASHCHLFKHLFCDRDPLFQEIKVPFGTSEFNVELSKIDQHNLATHTKPHQMPHPKIRVVGERAVDCALCSLTSGVLPPPFPYLKLDSHP